MKTPKQIYDEAQDRAKNIPLCTRREYSEFIIDLLVKEIGEHKKEIELQKEEIKTLIDFIGKEQYIRFKNKGLNYKG